MRLRRALLALFALGALAVATAATAATPAHVAVIKTKGGERYVPNPANPPNKMDVNTLHWAPGTITVHSGQKIRIVDSDHSGDPHVLAIARKRDLPNVNTNPATNPVLQAIAPKLLVDPNNPQAGFKAYRSNAGKPGLNREGDALVIVPGGPHKTATWFVSAKPGTVLYYFCAIHFWMQGRINVVK